MITQSTRGSSKPSVSTLQLVSTEISLSPNRRSVLRRSTGGIAPQTAAAAIPRAANAAARAWTCPTLTQNTMARRPGAKRS